jgi:hypothetical protein
VDLNRGALDRHFSANNRIRVNSRVERGRVLLSHKDIPEAQVPMVMEALKDSCSQVCAAA